MKYFSVKCDVQIKKRKIIIDRACDKTAAAECPVHKQYHVYGMAFNMLDNSLG